MVCALRCCFISHSGNIEVPCVLHWWHWPCVHLSQRATALQAPLGSVSWDSASVECPYPLASIWVRPVGSVHPSREGKKKTGSTISFLGSLCWVVRDWLWVSMEAAAPARMPLQIFSNSYGFVRPSILDPSELWWQWLLADVSPRVLHHPILVSLDPAHTSGLVPLFTSPLIPTWGGHQLLVSTLSRPPNTSPSAEIPPQLNPPFSFAS